MQRSNAFRRAPYPSRTSSASIAAILPEDLLHTPPDRVLDDCLMFALITLLLEVDLADVDRVRQQAEEPTLGEWLAAVRNTFFRDPPFSAPAPAVDLSDYRHQGVVVEIESKDHPYLKGLVVPGITGTDLVAATIFAIRSRLSSCPPGSQIAEYPSGLGLRRFPKIRVVGRDVQRHADRSQTELAHVVTLELGVGFKSSQVMSGAGRAAVQISQEIGDRRRDLRCCPAGQVMPDLAEQLYVGVGESRGQLMGGADRDERVVRVGDQQHWLDHACQGRGQAAKLAGPAPAAR